MTITYDPTHRKYFDETDLREEMNRVFDLCHGCRLCFKYCTSFPTLFAYVDAKPNQAAELMSPAEQDRVIDECFQCKLCDINCPYTPSQQHEWQLDFPRLVLRAKAVRKREQGRSLADQAFGRTDLVGRLSSPAAPIANKVMGKPNTPVRKVMEKVLGIAQERVLPPYSRVRFSTWFNKRGRKAIADRQAKVAVFPTCLVEYQNPRIGKDLVAVYEHNRVECSLPGGIGCCGAPWLHAGDFENFTKQAEKNVGPLAKAIREGYEIVVPQPTCSYVLKKDYPAYLKGTPMHADAELIGAHTFDSSEFLWKLHKGEGTSIATEFPGEIPASTAYHAACHLKAQQIGLKSRDLIKLTGTKITLVNECSAIDGTWGLRAQNYDIAKKIARPMRDAIQRADAEVVVGDCHLANGAIHEETGDVAQHPLSFMARAYGLDES